MRPNKADNDKERISRIDLMLEELGAIGVLKIRAAELVDEIHERTRKLAEIVNELKKSN